MRIRTPSPGSILMMYVRTYVVHVEYHNSTMCLCIVVHVEYHNSTTVSVYSGACGVPQ